MSANIRQYFSIKQAPAENILRLMGYSVFDVPEKYDTIPMSIGTQNPNFHQKYLESIPKELDVIGKQIVDDA